jgi:very-short-patch-repair endonuclease
MENEERLRSLAVRQLAMVSRRQATAAGVSWEALRSRLRAGSWTLVNDRVIRLAGAPRHRLEPLMAATLYGGDGTVVNRRSGAYLWGVPGFPEVAPQVSRRRGSASSSPPGVELTLLRYLPEHLTTSVGGIPVVTLPFLLFQLAGSERRDRAERAIDTVCTRSPGVHRRLAALLPELAEHGRNGIVVMREWLERNPPGSRPVASGLEGRFQRILHEAGERPLDRQVDVGGHEWIGRIDFVDRELSALFEVDSLLHHTSELDTAHDADRDERLRRAGWAAVERIAEEWIWYDADRAVRVVRETRRRLRRQLRASGS